MASSEIRTHIPAEAGSFTLDHRYHSKTHSSFRLSH